MENTQKKPSNRVFYMDVLRTIACMSVVLLHANVSSYFQEIGSFNFWTGIISERVGRIGVPLFIMISGAFLLDKNHEFGKEKLIKHIKKMATFYIFWSVVFCILYEFILKMIIKHTPIDIYEVIAYLIEGKNQLWFIYLIIGLYLIVPLLRLWVKDENKKYVEYFIILSLIFSFLLPNIIHIGLVYSEFFNHFDYIVENNLCLRYVGGFTIYFILGWYLRNYDFKNKKIIYISGISCYLLSIVITYILSMKNGEATRLIENLEICTFMQAACVFVFIKEKFENSEGNKFINTISANSLGIYALHVPIKDMIYFVFERRGLTCALVNIPLVFIVSFSLSVILTIIFRKIPFLKKVI